MKSRIDFGKASNRLRCALVKGDGFDMQVMKGHLEEGTGEAGGVEPKVWITQIQKVIGWTNNNYIINNEEV